ncbi:MAG: hypothetical protein IPJ90_08285 [Anaerolineaceae bacterium]|nr:hypothetical protein [Anaerolineaceae bacterium]
MNILCPQKNHGDLARREYGRMDPTPHPKKRNCAGKILFVGGDLARKGGLVLLEAFRQPRSLANDPASLELHLVTRDAVAT